MKASSHTASQDVWELTCVWMLTCLFKCFRYMPQALQKASSKRPNLLEMVLLCISDLWKDFLSNQMLVKLNAKAASSSVYYTSAQVNKRRFTLTSDARRRSVLSSDWSELSWWGIGPEDCPSTSHILTPADPGIRFAFAFWTKNAAEVRVSAHLYKLQQILWQLVIRQALHQTAQRKLSDYRIGKVTVQQLQSGLWLHQWPFLQ